MVTIQVQRFGGTHPWLSHSLLLLREVLGVQTMAPVLVEGTEKQESPHCCRDDALPPPPG